MDVVGRRVLDPLEPFPIAREERFEWPGTHVLGHTASVCRHRLNGDVVEVLLDAADALYDWQQPGLPEALCVLRDDGTPWLASIAHEEDAWFELTEPEHEHLLCAVP